jgi:hypothetical protein
MEFDASVRITRSTAEVFAKLADIQESVQPPESPVAAMEKIPPGPTAVGTRWREVVRLGPWFRMTRWSEVTAIEPGKMLAERFWGGSMRGTLVYTRVARERAGGAPTTGVLDHGGMASTFRLARRPHVAAPSAPTALGHTDRTRTGSPMSRSFEHLR